MFSKKTSKLKVVYIIRKFRVSQIGTNKHGERGGKHWTGVQPSIIIWGLGGGGSAPLPPSLTDSIFQNFRTSFQYINV